MVGRADDGGRRVFRVSEIDIAVPDRPAQFPGMAQLRLDCSDRDPLRDHNFGDRNSFADPPPQRSTSEAPVQPISHRTRDEETLSNHSFLVLFISPIFAAMAAGLSTSLNIYFGPTSGNLRPANWASWRSAHSSHWLLCYAPHRESL